MKKEWEKRDMLLFLIVIMLGINIMLNLPIKKLNAETFKLDDCITTRMGDRPTAYLHVITH